MLDVKFRKSRLIHKLSDFWRWLPVVRLHRLHQSVEKIVIQIITIEREYGSGAGAIALKSTIALGEQSR